MASIARTIRPVVSRFSASTGRNTAAWRQSSSSIRAFSATGAAQAKRFTKEHEWVELSEDKKSGVIGISEYAAKALGDVVYVELPTTPLSVSAGDSIGAVESVKSASDINSPITCTITDVNEILEEKPGSINHGPEDAGAGGGWYAKFKVEEAGVKDYEDLMDEAAYKEFVAEE